MNLEIYNMTDYDLSLIKDILIDDFDDFWTYDVLQEELNNPNSEYFVAKLENNILGFAGIWKAVDDVHITDIVVKKPDGRVHLRSGNYRRYSRNTGESAGKRPQPSFGGNLFAEQTDPGERHSRKPGYHPRRHSRRR